MTILKKIGEYQGRQDLFCQQSPELLGTLKQHAIVESVESSNRLEQITAPKKRIIKLVVQSTKPKDRNEREIAGYRDALALIHESHEYMDVNINVIKQIHTMIYKYLSEDGGRFKSSDNEIIEKDVHGNVGPNSL